MKYIFLGYKTFSTNLYLIPLSLMDFLKIENDKSHLLVYLKKRILEVNHGCS